MMCFPAAAQQHIFAFIFINILKDANTVFENQSKSTIFQTFQNDQSTYFLIVKSVTQPFDILAILEAQIGHSSNEAFCRNFHTLRSKVLKIPTLLSHYANYR